MVLYYVLIAFAIGLVGVLVNWYVFKKKVINMALLKAVAEDVVKAVEQVGSTKSSQEKKALAITLAQQILKSQNVNVSDAVIGALIEAAVFAMNFFIKPSKKQENGTSETTSK